MPDRSPRNSPLPLNSVEAGYESPKEMVRLPGHGSPASKRPCSHSPPDQQKDGVPMRESANSSIPLKKRKGLAQYPEPGAQTPPSPETPVGSVSAECKSFQVMQFPQTVLETSWPPIDSATLLTFRKLYFRPGSNLFIGPHHISYCSGDGPLLLWISADEKGSDGDVRFVKV